MSGVLSPGSGNIQTESSSSVLLNKIESGAAETEGHKEGRKERIPPLSKSAAGGGGLRLRLAAAAGIGNAGKALVFFILLISKQFSFRHKAKAPPTRIATFTCFSARVNADV
ncbi:hypothetical protein FF1_044564 [Malus domestica]